MQTTLILALCVALSNAGNIDFDSSTLKTSTKGDHAPQMVYINNQFPYNANGAGVVSDVILVISAPSQLTIRNPNISVGAISAGSTAPAYFTVTGHQVGTFNINYTVYFLNPRNQPRHTRQFSGTYTVTQSKRDVVDSNEIAVMEVRDNGCPAGTNTDIANTGCLWTDNVNEYTWNTWSGRVNTAQIYIKTFTINVDVPQGIYNYTQSWTNNVKLSLNAGISSNFEVASSSCGTYGVRFYFTYTKSTAPGSTTYNWNTNLTISYIAGPGETCGKREVVEVKSEVKELPFVAQTNVLESLPVVNQLAADKTSTEANGSAITIVSFGLLVLALLF